MADVSAEFVENCGFELLRTGYTPPDGYRLLQIGEVVQKDDIFLAVNGEHWPAKRIGETVNNNRYIRRIEVSQPCVPCDSGDTGDTTISEQLAEIEGQAEDTPATEYTLPDGWQEVPSGEPLKGGDEYHAGLNRYIRRTEPQSEPQPEPVPVQVCEGRWRTRGGDIRNVTPTPECDNRHDRFPWRDTAYDQTWASNGRYFVDCEESPLDLEEYLGPIEQQPEPQPEPVPEPVKVREGRWKTRGGDIRNVTPTPAGDGREHRFPWWDPQYRQTWAEDGRYHVRGESPSDLVEYLGPIEPQPQPQPQPDPEKLPEGCRNDGGWSSVNGIEPEPWPEPQPEPQPQPEHLQAIITAQAETIARLQSEAHELNMEIGGLQKELGEARAELAGAIQSRDALAAVNREIRRNETLREQLDAAAAQLQKRHPDHVGRAISTDEWMDQFARDASVSRLQADRNDLAGKVITLREQLQQANDRLAFLETLQPIAAACHTAQTMVRDMLGHMRCLLALQHTTDRRDSCTLLESILEVFDDAECDEDEDEDGDTTNTSEAGQG